MKNAKPETGSFFQRDRTWHPPVLTPLYKTSVTRSPQRAPISFANTLSEITGPTFGHEILGALDNDLTLNFARPGESAIGPRIIVYGRVLDERGIGQPNVLVEFWQANAGAATGTRRTVTWLLSTRISAAAAAPSPTRKETIPSAPSCPAPILGRTDRTTGGRRTSTSPFSATVSSSA